MIAADLIPLRVEMAEKHSADRVVDAYREPGGRRPRGGPDGADVVIDTTGTIGIFDRCLGLIRREGRITMQGYYPDPISIDFHPTHMQRPTVIFPCGWDDEFNDELADRHGDGADRDRAAHHASDPVPGRPRRTSWWWSIRGARSAWCWTGARPRPSPAMSIDRSGGRN